MYYEVLVFFKTGFQVFYFKKEDEALNFMVSRFELIGLDEKPIFNKEYFDRFGNKILIQTKQGDFPNKRTYWEDSELSKIV